MPAREDIPSTIRRSAPKAQRTWSKAHDSAVETYGEGERSHRTAFAALKHTHEKVGDHWEPKNDPGPSDPQAERNADATPAATASGVDTNASKQHLYDLAKRMSIPGRSRMTKQELVEALEKANRRATDRART